MKYFITAGQSLREPADAILLEWTYSIVLKLHFCESHFLHFLFPVTGCKCSPGHTHTHILGAVFFPTALSCVARRSIYSTETPGRILNIQSVQATVPQTQDRCQIHGNGAINVSCASLHSIQCIGKLQTQLFFFTRIPKTPHAPAKRGWLSN